MTTKLSYRPDIDGLRAVSVLGVLLYHYGFTLLPGGFIGVDVFFVISGYLITNILVDEMVTGSFSILRFYERRIRRILPAAFVTVLSCMIAGYLLLLPNDYSDLSLSAIYSSLSLANIYFFQNTGYFSPQADLMPLLHFWSLGVEEQFYVFWPILLAFTAITSSQSRPAMIAVLFSVFVLSFLLSIYQVAVDPKAAFFLPQNRAWELALGGILVFAPSIYNARRPWFADVVDVTGIALIVAAMVILDSQDPFPGFNALLPCMGAALVIWPKSKSTVVSRLLSTTPMSLIGLMSFSLYLWHWPVLVFYRVYANGAVPSPTEAIALAAVALGLGWISWRYVEQPFRRRTGFGLHPVACSLSLGTVLIVASMVIYRYEGIPQRFESDIALIAAGEQDFDDRRYSCFLGHLPNIKDCPVGGSAESPSFLLWGDSHAAALVPAFDELLNAAEVAGVFAGVDACPPLIGVITDAQPSCADFNQTVLSWIDNQGSDSPHTVILAARWPLYASGRYTENNEPFGMQSADDSLADAGNWAAFSAGLQKTVEALHGRGKKIVFLGTVPEIGWPVPSTLANAAKGNISFPEPTTRAEVALRNEKVDNFAEPLIRKVGGIYVKIYPWLCKPDCITIEGSRTLYSDDDHVSVFGAKTFITPILNYYLKKLD